MSREAFGDPPESQEAPDLCPVCGGEWHAEDCDFGKEVALRLKAERDAHKMAFENARLRAAIGEAYGYLWCVNNEPGTPHQYPPERAAYEARKLLRDLLTTQERGRFINAAVAAVRGSPAGCKTPFGCEERGCLGWCDEHRPEGTAVPDSKTPNAEVTGLQRPERTDDEHTDLAGR